MQFFFTIIHMEVLFAGVNTPFPSLVIKKKKKLKNNQKAASCTHFPHRHQNSSDNITRQGTKIFDPHQKKFPILCGQYLTLFTFLT